MHDGDDECKHKKVRVCFEEGLLNRVLVLLIFVAHQVSEHVKPVSHLLCAVHLPLEHGERLESDGEVDFLHSVVQRLVILVHVPIVIDEENWLVVLHAWCKLDELVKWRWDLPGYPRGVVTHNVDGDVWMPVRDYLLLHSFSDLGL